VPTEIDGAGVGLGADVDVVDMGLGSWSSCRFEDTVKRTRGMCPICRNSAYRRQFRRLVSCEPWDAIINEGSERRH
jgi:hypothetical protein